MRELVKSAAISIFQRALFDDRITNFALNGSLARRFISGGAGASFGLSATDRSELLRRFKVINRNVRSATQWPSYLVMAEFLLNVPSSLKGDVVECGCYKGASTAALSLLCAKVGRKLIVCDSFEGLPADLADAQHRYPHLGATTTYHVGDFAGRLEEVKQNIAAYGDLSVCEFVQGFYSESLRSFDRDLVFGFFDVDLLSSMQDCIRYLWPHFRNGSIVFTDDSCDMEVVKIWFDREFWQANLNCEPPGYIGSGCGLPSISPAYSSLGYALKGVGTLSAVSFT
ncbi:TylF/MycF/NovP-related O-methyltransferase [Bradyrhizobium sp. WSM3983]|uniref:TylF/MycF/NovP-related O-methyltransferase n=1 Tax=Bradyrhizobium sp. WSM3983 TaxID=1038867 RepID=UPI0003F8174D|nr:TylF/MycF/NovP-related O-methyltransferase [Bradyrhizobium sp. WSM3983]